MATKKGPKPGGSVRVVISDYNVYIYTYNVDLPFINAP